MKVICHLHKESICLSVHLCIFILTALNVVSQIINLVKRFFFISNYWFDKNITGNSKCVTFGPWKEMLSLTLFSQLLTFKKTSSGSVWRKFISHLYMTECIHNSSYRFRIEFLMQSIFLWEALSQYTIKIFFNILSHF